LISKQYAVKISDMLVVCSLIILFILAFIFTSVSITPTNFFITYLILLILSFFIPVAFYKEYGYKKITVLFIFLIFITLRVMSWMGSFYGLMFLIVYIFSAIASKRIIKKKKAVMSRFQNKIETIHEKQNLIKFDSERNNALVAALRKKLNRYANLKTITEAFNVTLELKLLTEIIADKVKLAIDEFDAIYIFLFDVNKTTIKLEVAYSKGSVDKKLISQPYEDIFNKWVLFYQSPLIVTDIERDFRFPKQIFHEVGSVMCCPLISDNKVIGLLRIDSKKKETFSVEDLRIFNIVSDIASIAVNNAFLYEKAKDMALRDSLTNLFTRHVFQQKLSGILQEKTLADKKIAVFMVDIDDFKKLNDEHGHIAGDLVLKKIAEIFKQLSREHECAARYGGEEFSLLTYADTREEILNVARKIHQEARQVKVNLRRETIGVTISLGIALYPDDTKNVSELLKIADKFLYEAKKIGKDKICASFI